MKAFLVIGISSLWMSCFASSMADEGRHLKSCATLVGVNPISSPSDVSQVNLAVENVLRLAQIRLPQKVPLNLRTDIDPTYREFTSYLYTNQILEASELTALLSDKLIMGRLISHYLGAAADEIMPPVLGLKEFLAQENLVDASGVIKVSMGEVTHRMSERFKDGFVLKPTYAMASGGKGVFVGPDQVKAALESQQVYTPFDWNRPYYSNPLRRVASGERYMLMGLIKGTKVVDPESAKAESHEIRVHSFWGNIVQEATTNRWYVPVEKEVQRSAENKVAKLLDQLPDNLKIGLAWSFDVFVGADGQAQIIEVNSNRGLKGGWSGFLRTGPVLGAHVRWLESQWNWRFAGLSGELLRNDVGSARKWIKVDIGFAIDEWREGRDPQLILEDLALLKHEVAVVYLALVAARPSIQVSSEIRRDQKYLTDFLFHANAVEKVGDAGWTEMMKWHESLSNH